MPDGCGAGADAYLTQALALLPQGRAWPRDEDALLTRFWHGVAGKLAVVQADACALLNVESYPCASLDLLGDWERVLGLPDPCVTAALTVIERQLTVCAKLATQGGQSRAYFAAVASALGYAITIEEFRPFVCGLSACGDPLFGGHDTRFYWRVRVPGPRTTRFRTGISRAGERLLEIARAEDLECVLDRLKPAHTVLLFAYQGV